MLLLWPEKNIQERGCSSNQSTVTTYPTVQPRPRLLDFTTVRVPLLSSHRTHTIPALSYTAYHGHFGTPPLHQRPCPVVMSLPAFANPTHPLPPSPFPKVLWPAGCRPHPVHLHPPAHLHLLHHPYSPPPPPQHASPTAPTPHPRPWPQESPCPPQPHTRPEHGSVRHTPFGDRPGSRACRVG